MPRLTLCAIVLNEQELLPDMLESVVGLADEVVLGLDSRTSDRTAMIAHSYGARVIDVPWRDDFSYARNLTINAATGDWILALDADERLLPAGAAAIRDVLEHAPEVAAADAATGTAFCIGNRELVGTSCVLQLSASRLFRNRPEIRFRGVIHEEISWLPDPQNTTCMVAAGGPHIAHYGYDPVLWHQRGKYERNRQLLEQRIAADPTDEYARDRLRALTTLSPSGRGVRFFAAGVERDG